MFISVIIPTYNRSKYLTNFLNSFLALKQDPMFNYEIILVDNNSTDNTKEVINDFSKNSKIKVKYLFEPKQGISNARNLGIKNASGDILAFTDDDVILNEDWLFNIADFAAKNTFDAIGGKVIPEYPANTPRWILKYKDLLSGPILSHDHGDLIVNYKGKMVPFVGANMIVKRAVFDEMGFFNTGIGAGSGTMGEDTELYKKMLNADKKIIYNPNIQLKHPVVKERMNLDYIAKWYIGFGKYKARIYDVPTVPDGTIFWSGVPRYLFKELVKRFILLLFSIYNQKRFITSWIIYFDTYGQYIEHRNSHVN